MKLRKQNLTIKCLFFMFLQKSDLNVVYYHILALSYKFNHLTFFIMKLDVLTKNPFILQVPTDSQKPSFFAHSNASGYPPRSQMRQHFHHRSNGIGQDW